MKGRGRNIMDNGHYNSRDKQQGWVFTPPLPPQGLLKSCKKVTTMSSFWFVLPSLSTLFIESP
ncbi:unnamed protein product, partial [Musa banksii]